MENTVPSILSVKQDFLFKLLFGDERNVDILADFLSAVLALKKEELENITFLDTVLKKEHEGDKISILDVNIKTKSGKLVNIEIQMINKKDYEDRTTYYTSRRLVEQLGEGEPYTSLAQTISINIINFDLFPYTKYHSTFVLMEETEKVKLTDIIRIDFLELEKAKRVELGSMDEKLMWMYFINAESEEELTMLAQKSEVFKKPVAEVIRLSADKSVRAEYEARQKEIRDKIAEIEYAKHSKAVEIAINLLGILDNTIIAEKTGLTLEDIEKLQR